MLLGAADLDGTLIFSAATIGTGDGRPPRAAAAAGADGRPGCAAGCAAPDGAVPGAVGEPAPAVVADGRHPVEQVDGLDSAWVATAAVEDLRALTRSGRLVPATTRSLAQYERLVLPGPRPRWSIVANGGQLLREGEPQRWWESRVRALITAESVPTTAVLDHLYSLGTRGWVRTIRDVHGMFTYLVATAREAVPAEEVDALVTWGAPRGLEISVQGRKIYLVPRSLTKQAAMAAVVDLVGAEGFVAAGDSLLDAGLLEAAVAGIRPAHGELHASVWNRPWVTVTATAGVAAGVEIAAWLRARVGGSPVATSTAAPRPGPAPAPG